jgi:HK97 family phage major capsid protein
VTSRKDFIVKTRTLHVGLLSLAALATIAIVALAAGDLSHLAQLVDWRTAAVGGLSLAEGAVAINVQTIQDQIKAYKAKREAAVAKAAEIMDLSVKEGRTLDEHEEQQLAEADADVAKIDKHLGLLAKREQTLISQATPVTQDAGRDGNGASKGTVVDVGAGRTLSVKSNLPPGIRFVRVASLMADAKGNVMLAAEMAKTYFSDTPEVVNVMKAAVHLGGLHKLSRANDSDLVSKAAVTPVYGTDSAVAQYNDLETEFIDLLRPKTIMGRMTQLRRVPFMSRMGRQLTGVTGAFVGEGAPKPVQKLTFDNATLGYAKVAVIVVLSDEARKFNDINAETRVRDDMVAGIATYVDKRFMDPAYSAVANVSPASITNAATRVQGGTATSLAGIDAVVASAFAPFSTSDVDPSSAVWVMSAATALKLSMRRNSYDEYAYPDISINGGTWMGLPVIVSSAMAAVGSPTETQIALVTQSEVLLAEEGLAIDMSTEASLQLNDAPSAGAQSLVSLWQNNLMALRAERYINWAPRRPNNLGIVLIENLPF